MILYEVNPHAFKDEDQNITETRYFTRLKDAINYVQKEVEPSAVDYELYQVEIEKLTVARNKPLLELICNVANQRSWVAKKEKARSWEYDHDTGKRICKQQKALQLERNNN